MPRLGVWAGLLVVTLAARAESSFFATRITPILEQHCVVCHGSEKQKGKLRLDSFAAIMQGAESGAVIVPGDLAGSELRRRITLPHDDEEVMPSDGKPLLSADEIKLIELWIAAGASSIQGVADFPTAPALKPARRAVEALAPDWREHAQQIAALERELGLKLAPRSWNPGDGLVLRTASAPSRCDDAALAKLAPVARFIVEAELARTRITDAGLASLAAFENLRVLDLTRTKVGSPGLARLAPLKKLEVLNLTGTEVDDEGIAELRKLPRLQRLWSFGARVGSPSPATAESLPPGPAAPPASTP